MIEARNLTKRYGETTAVSDLTFTVRPGIVTGFLGPNGSGKSTTMRLILGLDAPSEGEVKVNGKRYAEFPAPLHEVGALLEARSVHTGRSAYNHLLAMAQTHGIPRRRVDELIELVGLPSVAKKRAGQFSLGMGQRLGIASALLGDPQVVVLDEPVNGLDPEGVLWIRNLLNGPAAEGPAVAVRTPEAAQLRDLLLGPDVTVTSEQSGVLHVQGLTAEQIGTAAWQAHLPVYKLTAQQASLEEAFMQLTDDSVDFRSHDAMETVVAR